MKEPKDEQDKDVAQTPAEDVETTPQAQTEPAEDVPEGGGDSVADAAQAMLEAWLREAEAARAEYPELELCRELEDPRFLAMVCAGVGVKTAYEVTHLDAVKAAVAQAAAREREKAVTDDILARGARPAENGVGAQNALRAKIDVARMTRAQRADIARRAGLGEVITLRS